MSTFKLSDYDCIGFDLDHTLLWYNVTNMIEMEYQVLSKYLVTKKNYNPEFLQKPLTPKDIDFMQKGLVLDFDRGNILKPDFKGVIQRVNHGIASLSNPLDVWKGPHSKMMRALMDYYDMPASLTFARAVDDIDSRSGGKTEKYEAWNDVTEALMNMYERGQFKKNLGEYFVNLKTNPDKYLRKCSQEIVSWLKELKKNESYFSALEGYEEAQEVKGDELTRGGIYSQGNWKELKSLFGKITGKSEPKCLYLGDNLIQDVFVPAGHAGLDSVVVSEEMHDEGMDHITLPHSDAETMVSNYWGSYFSVKISIVPAISRQLSLLREPKQQSLKEQRHRTFKMKKMLDKQAEDDDLREQLRNKDLAVPSTSK
ncbi:hypothetical protein G9C98_003427 [Cotesia typhae]|uniref:Uncharacterized protein n=1 Tax=Cotesia typhae TaxID=2053667 RepID=A0A8J5UVB1_9HYME|nr:hypothetical protein G9C98_003427 [Cotesia typhae]